MKIKMKVFILFVTLVMSSHAKTATSKKPKNSQEYIFCCKGKHAARYAWAKNNCLTVGWTSKNVPQGVDSPCTYSNPQKYVS
jgi:hypothetical protein